MLFYYNDETVVAGHEEGVQGLAGQGGTPVHIAYRAEGERAIAERIELNPEGAGANEPIAEPVPVEPAPAEPLPETTPEPVNP
jgi:hypothetical protein